MNVQRRNIDMGNIGDMIEYMNEFDEKITGEVSAVMSDMDSYDEMRLENGVPLYWSKKLSSFVPVKEKNMQTVFLEVTRPRATMEYVSFEQARFV